MYLNRSVDIIKKANRIVRAAGSRDPERIAEHLGITIIPCAFSRQEGIYKVIKRNRFIFIKDDLCPEMRKIVLLHEIGHDVLHRGEAETFQEFSIFDIKGDRMEYEANSFAAEVSLPDGDMMECICQGLDAAAIAKRMDSNVSLVALKMENLKRRRLLFQKPCSS